MNDTRISFPCDYPIKVIGDAGGNFLDDVVSIVRRHDPTLGKDRVTCRNSKQGNYTAVSIQLIASSEQQLQALIKDLNALAAVRLLL